MKILFHVRVFSNTLYDYVFMFFHHFRIMWSSCNNELCCLFIYVPYPWGETHFVVFYMRCNMRLKKQLSIERIMECSTNR